MLIGFHGSWALAGDDGCFIAADVSDQLIPEALIDQRFMTRSARCPSENSSKAHEKVASEGNALLSGKSQMRHSARSIFRRSINPVIVVMPITAFATKAFAKHARSWRSRQTPHHEDVTNPSIGTHSRV